MKKLVFLLFVFGQILYGVCFAEVLTKENCDPNGCKECLPLFPDLGKSEVNYTNGKINGTQKLYYKNGNLWQEISYKNGKPDGSVKIYYPDGQLWEELLYKHGSLLDAQGRPFNGIYHRSYKTGQLAREVIYKNGLPDGESRSYYENGNIQTVETFNGLNKRQLKTFNEQGQLMADGQVVNQWFTGIHRMYDDSGQLEWEYAYVNNAPSGVTKHFGKDGNVDLEYLFKNGKFTGHNKRYYASGQLQQRGRIRDGRWDGPIEVYYPSGQLKTRFIYKDGKEFSLKEYDEQGKLIHPK